MKALFRTCLALAMALSMAACGEKTNYEPEDDSQWAPVVDPEEDEEEKPQNNPIFKVCLETMVNARLKARKTDSKATYNNWGSKAQIIDHIFVSGFDIPQYKTVNQEWAGVRYISDHFPIYALLTFK